MKTILLILSSILIFQNVVFAQDSTEKQSYAPNAVYVELLGSGLLYSVNYERMLNKRQNFRIGIGYTFGDEYDLLGQILSIPVSSSYLVPTDEDSHLEFGFGALYIREINSTPVFAIGPILGFKEQNIFDGGLLIRITFTPMMSASDWKVQPWGGVSFGSSF